MFTQNFDIVPFILASSITVKKSRKLIILII